MALDLSKIAYGDLSITINTLPVAGGDFDVNQINAHSIGSVETSRSIMGITEDTVLTSSNRTVQASSSDRILHRITLTDFISNKGRHFYSVIPPNSNDDTILKFWIQKDSEPTKRSPVVTIDKDSLGYTSFYQAWLNGCSEDWSSDALNSKSTVNTIVGLDDQLTEIGAEYQTNLNLLSEYLYKFTEYWQQKIAGDNSLHTIGWAYAELRRVGVLADNNDAIKVNDPMSESLPNILFTQLDLDLFNEYIKPEEVKSTVSRQDIITACASIAAKLTEYWSIIYSTAAFLGFFFPENWDCLDQLEEGIASSVYAAQLPLVANNKYIDNHWTRGPAINTTLIPSVTIETKRVANYKYYNANRSVMDPILTEPVIGYSNTNDYYRLWQADKLSYNTPFANYWGVINEQHRSLIDSCDGYYVEFNTVRPQYTPTSFAQMKTLAQTVREWIAPAVLPGLDYNPITVNTVRYNPSTSFIAWVAQHSEYNDAYYYQLQEERQKIWNHLYSAYPGIFRESNYTNQDAATSRELYAAAKTQLDVLSEPQFSYQLTGMDIYMHDSDYNPTTLQIGDQIRIDYQEDVHQQDTLNKALATPLYVTGIRHSLRNDGDYQFEVSTTRGTDVMMQRFAQLLSFGK